MPIKLYSKRGGEGPAVLLLHGLFGAGSNLGALARSLQDRYTTALLDLPNHGRSEWLAAPDLPSMATAVASWMDQQGVSSAHLIGHSLGGKVAMQLALQLPARVTSLTVADIAPVAYSGGHDAVFAALQAVADAACTSRDMAADIMAAHLSEQSVIRFLLLSLQRDKAGIFQWRLDLEGLRRAYPQLSAAPQASKPFGGPVLFIKGGDSDYISSRHWPQIEALFPQATIRILPGTGHWLHAEKPQLFNGTVARFLAAHSA